MAQSSYSSYIYADEVDVVGALLKDLSWDNACAKTVHKDAVALVETLRKQKRPVGQLETFLQQYSLNTPEGLSLMCLAEALLRIPDAKTADALIEDKIAAADWLAAAGQSKDLMTKMAGFGLSMTKKTLGVKGLSSLGKPVIREAINQAIRILGRQFVLGQSMEEALKRSKDYNKKGYGFSYDMLGEGARTAADAQRYFEAYAAAIDEIGAQGRQEQAGLSGISVKLSAIHPRYEYGSREHCVPELAERLTALCRKAASYNMSLSVDAEEVDRLETSLEIIRRVIEGGEFKDWEGLGIVIQAYQKRCYPLINEIAKLAKDNGQKLRVRLVKGAYWDTEIKRAQVMGLSDYPVFSRKPNTDVSYLACAQRLLEHQDWIFPMFATHNAHTIMAVMELAKAKKAKFEMQRLHGMGEGLYDIVLDKYKVPVTIYAPVGTHEDLLPYLVRRLLENGANSSFVNKLLDNKIPAAEIVADPVEKVRGYGDAVRHPQIRMPVDLFQGEAPNGRRNSKGMDITCPAQVNPVLDAVEGFNDKLQAGPFIGGKLHKAG